MGNFLGSPKPNAEVDVNRSCILRKPSAQNVLFDLPVELINQIFSVWLRGPRDVSHELRMMDVAVCNKTFRPILLQMYRSVHFDRFFDGAYASLVEKKMKWSLTRDIKFTEVTLVAFGQIKTLKSFFRANGRFLKVVRILDNSSLDRNSSLLIAKHCTKLDTLCIEKCQLSVAIADIANKCSLKELRLKKQSEWGAPVKNNLIERIHCPSLTKLALLDNVELQHTESIVKAFPNVVDFEIQYPNRNDEIAAIFAAFFTSWSKLHTLRLYGVYLLTEQSLDAIVLHCPHLRNLCFNNSIVGGQINVPEHFYSEILVNFVQRCTTLTSLTIHEHACCGLRSNTVIPVIAALNTRLKELCVGIMGYNNILPEALATHAPNLITLELIGYNQYGYDGSSMKDVYKNCPLLEELHYSIANVNNAQYDGVIPHIVDIGTYCKNMQTLLLQDSPHVQIEDVKYLVQNCPKLKSVTTNSKAICKEFGGCFNGVKILYCEPIDELNWRS